MASSQLISKPGNSSATDLIRVTWSDDWTMSLTIGAWLLIALIALVVILQLLRWRTGGSPFASKYEIDTAEMGIGDSKVIFRPNLGDKGVAYKIWVELSTRKIGLSINLDDDVISEIYDSWYSFFSVTRELVKDIPVSRVRHPSTKQIIALSIDVLNLGLRPHLTKWQARFRRWYDYKLSTDPEAKLHPQDLQKEFPGYDELVADMKDVNAKLMRYRERMNALVHA